MSLPSVCVVASTTVLNGPVCDDDASRRSTPLNNKCEGEACGEFDGGGVRSRESQGGGGCARPSNSTGSELGELRNEGPGRDIAPVPADGCEHQEETFLLPLCQQTASDKADEMCLVPLPSSTFLCPSRHLTIYASSLNRRTNCDNT